MTPERRAAAVQVYVTSGRWLEIWGKRPTQAEIEAAEGKSPGG